MESVSGPNPLGPLTDPRLPLLPALAFPLDVGHTDAVLLQQRAGEEGLGPKLVGLTHLQGLLEDSTAVVYLPSIHHLEGGRRHHKMIPSPCCLGLIIGNTLDALGSICTSLGLKFIPLVI